MRSTRADVDLDPADRLDPEAEGRASPGLAKTLPAPAPPPVEHAALPAGHHGLGLIPFTAFAVTLAVATYGVETERKSIAIVGLAATALVGLVIAVMARESERSREELDLANERLQRSNAALHAFHAGVVHGFAVIDERTNGRLSDLVEEAGDELADLIDDALDETSEDA